MNVGTAKEKGNKTILAHASTLESTTAAVDSPTSPVPPLVHRLMRPSALRRPCLRFFDGRMHVASSACHQDSSAISLPSTWCPSTSSITTRYSSSTCHHCRTIARRHGRRRANDTPARLRLGQASLFLSSGVCFCEGKVTLTSLLNVKGSGSLLFALARAAALEQYASKTR